MLMRDDRVGVNQTETGSGGLRRAHVRRGDAHSEGVRRGGAVERTVASACSIQPGNTLHRRAAFLAHEVAERDLRPRACAVARPGTSNSCLRTSSRTAGLVLRNIRGEMVWLNSFARGATQGTAAHAALPPTQPFGEVAKR